MDEVPAVLLARYSTDVYADGLKDTDQTSTMKQASHDPPRPSPPVCVWLQNQIYIFP